MRQELDLRFRLANFRGVVQQIAYRQVGVLGQLRRLLLTPHIAYFLEKEMDKATVILIRLDSLILDSIHPNLGRFPICKQKLKH